MKTRLTLIVGMEDEDEVFVIGAFNTEYLNQLDLGSAEEHIRKLKEIWTGDPSSYEWREVDCLIPMEQLEEAFSRPTIEGEVA